MDMISTLSKHFEDTAAEEHVIANFYYLSRIYD